MTEATLEKALARCCKRNGLFCWKLKATGVRGFPDRTIAHPVYGVLCYLELKTKTGRVSPHQARWIYVLRAMGYRAEIVRSIEEAETVIAEELTRCRHRSHN